MDNLLISPPPEISKQKYIANLIMTAVDERQTTEINARPSRLVTSAAVHAPWITKLREEISLGGGDLSDLKNVRYFKHV